MTACNKIQLYSQLWDIGNIRSGQKQNASFFLQV